MKIDADNDYYAVLGVLPTAEDTVIRAVYRALAQRYHPDRHPGSDTAKAKMQELNEAYAVLSNPGARKEYDELRSKRNGSDYGSFYEEKNGTASDDPIWTAWELATEYRPELNDVLNDLQNISPELAYSFQAFLVEEKKYSRAKSIAKQMREDFLRFYFGKNREIREFGLKLIHERQQEAARELNKVANLFGSEIDADRVIDRIRKKFNIKDDSGWGKPLEFSDEVLKGLEKKN